MTTITETCVEERLKPAPEPCTPMKKATKHSVPYSLMRSASFDRLKQFPTYFCRSGSAEIYRWLFSSKTKLSTTISHLTKQLHQILLTISVFGAVGVLGIQLTLCLLTVVSTPLPAGLNFLISCVVIIASLALRILFPLTPQRRSRTTARNYTRN